MGDKNDFEICEQDWESCPYCEQSYYEYDTGYTEYECKLVYDNGGSCVGSSIDGGCPLACKYKIEEDDNNGS